MFFVYAWLICIWRIEGDERRCFASVYPLYESSSSQVPFLLFSFSFLCHFCLDIFDCDSCFPNDLPTALRNIKHKRDVFPVDAITRVHCW